MMDSGKGTDLVHAAGYGPPGGGGYGPPGGGGGYGPPGGGGYGPPGGGIPREAVATARPVVACRQEAVGRPDTEDLRGLRWVAVVPTSRPDTGLRRAEVSPGGPMMGGGGPSFSPLAIASMILGILSIPSCCCWYSSAPPSGRVAGLVLRGIVGHGKDPQQPAGMEEGGGMAIAGIVCASIGLLLDIVAIF